MAAVRFFREWLHRLAGAIRPQRRDQDLEEELRLHLELAAEAARRRGASPEEASRLAVIEVGATPQAMEALRDQRGVPWLEDLVRDLGYGLRALGRHKGFTAAALLSLALGIGANAGIFSLFDQVLLRPLDVPGARRLVQFQWQWRGRSVGVEYGAGSLVSYPLCRDLESQGDLFDGVFCRYPTSVNVSTGSAHEPVRADVVSGSYFSTLGVRPLRGRLIAPSDDRRPDAHPVVVVSEDLWRQRLGAASDVVGRRLLVNNYPMTVIGVAPASFRGVDLDSVPAIWIPAMMKRRVTPDWDDLLNRRTYWMHALGRVRPGVTPEQARERLEPWFKTVLDVESRAETFPPLAADERADFLASRLAVLPATRGVSTLREGLERPLRVLLAGTMILLVLAALNVAGLLLARGAARTRELTTRLALGASRGRIARQLLVESTLLVALGGGLGLLVAPLVTAALRSFTVEGANLTTAIDVRVLLFAVVTSALTAAVCGMAPAFQAARLRLSAALSERSALGAGGGARLRKTLVAGQIAFALILLMAAGLFVQTLMQLQAKGRSIAGSQLLMVGVDPTSLGYSYEQAERVMRELYRRLHELPELRRVALANTRLLNGGTASGFLTIDSGERRVTDRVVHRMRVSPGFFAALGLQVVEGRDFDERDVRPPGSPQRRYRTAIVNETFARRYFGTRSPLGARLGQGTLPGTVADAEIVGVVRDVSRRTLRDRDIEQVFYCYWDNQSDNGSFYVTARASPESASAAVRKAIASTEPGLPILSLTTFDEQVRRSLRTERALATLSTGFGVIALIMCVVGIYGVMAFVATQRTQEIGVRMALGATRLGALWIVIRDALLMIGAGGAIALPVAVMLRRMVEGELFGVGALDGPTIATAGSGLAAAALGAAALPAWRAAIVPPMLAIHDRPESLWHAARAGVVRAIRDIGADGSRASLSAAALTNDIGRVVHGAASFADAIAEAIATLRERLGAERIMLLRRDGSTYRDGHDAIPADGLLLNRLSSYPHPLPITERDVQGWRRWAEALRAERLPEVDLLDRVGARMAVPLFTASEIVGVLLLGAPIGRDRYTDAERDVMTNAAGLFGLMLENARLNARAIEQERIRRDLALAAEVQRRLLPPVPPAASSVSLAAFTLPARTVGGDYYDFLDLPGGRMGIAVADIAGKGVAAALLMSVVQASLRVVATQDVACAELAAKMNQFLYRSTTSNGYATFFYAELDPVRQQLRYVNAGHIPPYIARRTNAGVDVIELTAGGTVLGLFPKVSYEEGQVALLPGDLIVACTDGVTEARDVGGEEFGEERVKQILRDSVGASAESVSATLSERLRAWSAGAEQHDDVTFVVVTLGAQSTSH
jgi:predicted permease